MPSSRNDLFFREGINPVPPIPKPPRLERPNDSPRSSLKPETSPKPARGHVKRPSFGRMSLEERKSEERLIRAGKAKIDIRLILEKPFKLGEGRSSEVYLGAYRDLLHDYGEPAMLVHCPGQPPGFVSWELCAVKRVQADRESQLAGLEEAFALRHLGRHPHIVRLITVLDEMGIRQDQPSDFLRIHKDDPPRLLIILEYLPFSLAQYVRMHPFSVDLRQWLEWATQLTSTIDWLHTRGCVHGDIKKENVLLSHDLSVKLCDFSSVLFSNAAVPATDVYSVGTPAFRAPELFSLSSWSPSEEHGCAHPALSFTLDIFSLGVLLYSLASGVDPSHRVKSVIAMRQRQNHFFISEEDDRMERMSFQESLPSSRSTDIHRSLASPSGRSSAASDVSSSHFMINDSVLDRLLDPLPLPHGIISQPSSATSSLSVPMMTRAISYSGTPKQDSSSLNRCVSLSATSGADRSSRRSVSLSKRAEIAGRPRPTSLGHGLPADTSATCDPLDATDMRGTPMMSSPQVHIDTGNDVDHSCASEPTDNRPYSDGAPALILPGGDRFPDKLRDLVRVMVSPNPEDRPSASQVLATLNNYHMV